jgi:hypothetical protein
LPAVEAFGTEATAADDIVGAAADADDAAVLNADFQAAAVGAEDAAGLNPLVGRFGGVLINAGRPLAIAVEGSARAPNVIYAVAVRVIGKSLTE